MGWETLPGLDGPFPNLVEFPLEDTRMRKSPWVQCACLSTLLVAACATSAPVQRTRTAPDLGPVNGGIAWLKNDDYLVRSAVWNDARVAAGDRGGPPSRLFIREANGKWKGGWQNNQTSELVAEGSRLTGPEVNVTMSRVEGGFRLSGLWFGLNVDLVVDAKGAESQGDTYVRDASGAYVSTDVPSLYIFLVGDAARLENPPWPEIALGALSAGWGIRSGVVFVR